MMNCWSFVGKVYAILTLQLLATIGVGATVRLVPSISHFLLKTHAGIAVYVVILVTPFIVLIPMFCLRHVKPVNYLLVAIFTVSLAFQVGITCVFTPGMVILESVFLTAVVFVTLTLYTFWAAWRGYDFSLLGPFLSEALLCLIIYVFIQAFSPLGKSNMMIFGALGSIVFCGYIVRI
ncbi:protein LIFEGUARD 2 [Rosa sericea]